MKNKMDTREKWLKATAGLYPAAKGSLREVKRNCSRPGCKTCKSGQRHPAWLITYYLYGRQYSKHVPKPMVEEMKMALENGRRIEELMVLSGVSLIETYKRK